MSEARLRIFAGPNGSGKSTLYESFSKRYNAGIFLNADLLEKELEIKGYVDLAEYNLNLNQDDLENFYKNKKVASLIQKSIDENFKIDISIVDNIIVDNAKETNGYLGTLISSFLRYNLQAIKSDFCFETVMSHSSKIDEISEAKLKGYKTYLYFICIDDPEVNISRVENRVKKGGHNVSPEKISTRYFNTLQNLILMINNVDKCYLFDNSTVEFKLIAKIIQNQLLLNTDRNELPNWFTEYVLKYYEVNED